MHDWDKSSGRAYITFGKGYGKTKLSAFDAAELDANILATNAIKVSSFIPPNWKVINNKDELKALTDRGAFLPMAYAYAISKNNKVSAAVVIGINKNKTKASIIAEHANENITEEQSIKEAENCIKEAFSSRGWEIDRLEKVSVEAEPKENFYVCSLVAVLFFPD